jgi:hypothetical protein
MTVLMPGRKRQGGGSLFVCFPPKTNLGAVNLEYIMDGKYFFW